MAEKDYNNLPLGELKEILKKKRQINKVKYKELREKIVKDILREDKINEKLRKKIRKTVPLNKHKNPLKSRKAKKKKYNDYFQECIKNKEIPKDTPPYLRKALERAIKENEQGIIKRKSALLDFANVYEIKAESGLLPGQFFRSKREEIKEFLRNHRNIKFSFVLVCLMGKKQGDAKLMTEIEEKAYFHSGNYLNYESTDVKELIKKAIISILQKINIYQQNGSGWYFKEVIHLEIHTNELDQLKGSSYIPLPDWIMRKGAIVSIRNKDNKCFLWSVLRYLHPRPKNGCRLADLKKYENELKIPRGFTFPVKVKDIAKFEAKNPSIPGINVFSLNDKKKFYLLKEALRDPRKTIDLFLYEENGKQHYSLIKNFSRLCRSQLTKRTNEPLQICKRCFNYFTKEDLLEKHIKYCMNNETAVVEMPKKGDDILQFVNDENKFPLPFVIYADFECFTKPMSSCCPNPEDSYNYNYQKHEPSGFCFYIKGICSTKFKPIIYTKKNSEDNVALIFVNKLVKVTNKIYEDFYCRPKPLILTKEEQKSFEKSKICHICNKEIMEKKVRDHCHFTGQYRGAAHSRCNLKCRKPLLIPVIFHNLQGYDAHLFIKQLASLPGKLKCIPSTEEKYISFSKYIKVDEYFHSRNKRMVNVSFEIRFIDSFKFLQTSLANLVSNLQPEDFINTKEIFKEKTNLITRKGVYPYDYVSSIKKLSESKLPPKEEFYSKLNDEHITEDDYIHAKKVWHTFDCKTIKDYHDLYLKSDVLLLADVFENFRKTCLKHYNLDPAHYYTSPGLAWDACLKETKQHLQLLTDYDMLMMFERGIRGGISHI